MNKNNDYQIVTIKEWRSTRNQAIFYFATDMMLRPARIARLTQREIYKEDHKPRRNPVVGEICISERLYQTLKKLNQQPFLINARPLTQPMFTDRPQGRGLTSKWICHIIKEMIKHERN